MTTPPGWPADLPGVGQGFEQRVTVWLLDRLPPEYRTSELRKHPLSLSLAAGHHARANLEAARQTYRELRASLRDHVEPAEVDESLAALQAVASQFTRMVREMDLVDQALRGHVWRPRL